MSWVVVLGLVLSLVLDFGKPHNFTKIDLIYLALILASTCVKVCARMCG